MAVIDLEWYNPSSRKDQSVVTFATIMDAAAAVPADKRKRGLVISFLHASGNWFLEQYIGTTLSDSDWVAATNWKDPTQYTLKNGEVTTVILRDNAVTDVKIANVSGSKIIDGSITAAKFIPGLFPTALPNPQSLTINLANGSDVRTIVYTGATAQTASLVMPTELPNPYPHFISVNGSSSRYDGSAVTVTTITIPKEWYGTLAQYNAITSKDANTTYYIYTT